MTTVESIVQLAIDQKASDIHLTQGQPPLLRINGQLAAVEAADITAADIVAMLDEGQRDALQNGQDLDFALSISGRRLRANVYRGQGSLAAAIRLLSDTIPTMEQLRLPPAVKKLAEEPRGLVLVTGPTGSGKSTTLASMIGHIAATRACHIITIEDPIEYVYQGRHKALIHQREVGRDVASFERALRAAMREDPDVILVGEMRDFETISAAVTAAETGHLVLSTLHTTGASKTVDRIIDVFPPHSQGQIRAQLSGVLKGVITQQLVPLAPGPDGRVPGRIAATEIMVGTDAVLNLIREGKAHQLGTAIQSGAALGMMTLDGCLAGLVRQRQITRETAFLYASNPGELRQLLG